MRSRKKRLSKQDLRDLGVRPGFMLHRVAPDGRARLEQLTPGAGETSSFFGRKRKQMFVDSEGS